MDINIVKLKKYAANCSMLYVEDDEVIRTATTSFLGRFFSDIVLAEDGALGLEAYKSREFDIVITDINMPNMNGIEMIGAIKDLKYEQPIIVTSAYNDSENLMQLLEFDVNRFVLKPFNNKQFLYVLYKIAEELTFSEETTKLQEEILAISKHAQQIVDHVDLGIIVIKNNKVEMANRAFLDIGGFDTFATLELEIPELGVLFEETAHCISVATNEEFIKELQSVNKEDSKVRILQDGKTIEYQVSLSQLDEDESYVITFTDITAIHNVMYLDEHTKLPARKFILEKIDLLKNKMNTLSVILLSIKHYESLKKNYGKMEAIEVEKEFSKSIKTILEPLISKMFIGYFNTNMFIIIPQLGTLNSEVYDKLKNIKIATINFKKKYPNLENDIEISTNITKENLDINKNINQIEVDLMNAFDMM